MRISDWSSDVCSSDLCSAQVTGGYFADPGKKDVPRLAELPYPYADHQHPLAPRRELDERGPLVGAQDRQSVGSGKSVSVRVDLGGRRYINKKTTKNDDVRQNQSK